MAATAQNMYTRTDMFIDSRKEKGKKNIERKKERKKEKKERKKKQMVMIRWRIVLMFLRRLPNPSAFFFLSPMNVHVHVSAIVYFNKVCSFGK